MAKSCTRIVEGNNSAGGPTATTASISAAANSLVLLAVFAYDTPNMSVSGAGLTWTPVTGLNGITTVDGGRFWVFAALVGGSIATGALTLTYDSGGFVNWAGDNITGTINTSSPTNANVASNTGPSTALAVTLAAFGNAANATWAYGYIIDSVSVTQGSGFSLVDLNNGSALFGHSDFSQFRDSNDTSVDATSSDGQPWGMVALEIVDSAAAGSSQAPRASGFLRMLANN